jgi:hypothetical protein
VRQRKHPGHLTGFGQRCGGLPDLGHLLFQQRQAQLQLGGTGNSGRGGQRDPDGPVKFRDLFGVAGRLGVGGWRSWHAHRVAKKRKAP